MPTILMLAVALLFAGCAGAAALDVPLTLEEPIGVARKEEPVTSGVPLPKGTCSDPSALRLVDARGSEVPAFFAAATKWWEDGSLKWVHVSFQRSLAAHGEETLHLRLGQPRAATSGELRVAETPEAITVVTGPLRFRVRRRGFNLLDQVWLDETGRGESGDAQAMLADRPRGARVGEGGHLARASADQDSEVTVEESNPFRVVIRAEGRHRLEGGAPLTDFITRITAYRGKSSLTISHAFLVRQGATLRDALSLHDITLAFPLRLQPGPEGLVYRFGGEQIHTGRIARQESVSLYQHDPDHRALFFATNEPWSGWRMGAQAEETGRSPRPGWVDLADERRGVAAGVRDFWQMFPKVLKAEADGDLSVELYPDSDYGQPLLVYPGTARTHEVLLSFHGRAESGTIADAMAAFQAPLALVAPPRWYCRDTQAFGQLAEADPSIYDPKYRDVVEAFARRFRDAFATILANREKRSGEPPVGNEYGIINYGDGVHWTEAGTIYWDDNYYDFPHALILQFARTGDRLYLDQARAYARHLGEVDNACWAVDPEAIGGPRVCPAIEHVRAYYDGGARISESFNFYKNQSLFEMWYLTGDHRFLETALLSANYALHQDGMGFSEPRSVGNGLISLVAAYEATGDRAYLDRGRVFWKRIAQYQDEHAGGFPNTYAFQGGLVTEGFRDWYRATADREALVRVRRLLDWMLVEYNAGEKGFKDPGGFTGLAGLGWISEATGDRHYLDFALTHARYWLTTDYGNKVKDYGMAFRSSPALLWWLQR